VIRQDENGCSSPIVFPTTDPVEGFFFNKAQELGLNRGLRKLSLVQKIGNDVS
jgi:hypothetical protein